MIPAILARFPRIALAQLPTPIAAIESPALGLRVHVKRDDLTGNSLSGNKVRKLEFLIADARRLDCDTLLTCGAVQSNCARALAVAAAQTGLHSRLILTGSVSDESDGNLLISRLAGAQVEFLQTDDPAIRDARLAECMDELQANGRKPYMVPFGGSSLVGALGYVQAAQEIASQLGPDADRFAEIITPMASGGTYAGLYVGFSLVGIPIRPVGAFVCGTSAEWVPTLLDQIHGLARLLGVVIAAEERDIRLIDARGHGYNQPSPAELDFIVRFTRDTGLLLDPVYSGKALFALWRYLDCGALGRAGEAMFLHTGGAFGLFPHRRSLVSALDRLTGDMQRPAATPAPQRRGASKRIPSTAQRRGHREPSPAAQSISIASP